MRLPSGSQAGMTKKIDIIKRTYLTLPRTVGRQQQNPTILKYGY